MNLHRWHKVKKGEICVANPLHYAGSTRNEKGVFFVSRTPKNSFDDTSDMACLISIRDSKFVFLGMSGRWCKVLVLKTHTIGYIGFTRIVPLYILNRRDKSRHMAALLRSASHVRSVQYYKHGHRIFYNRKAALARKKVEMVNYTVQLLQVDLPLELFIVDNPEVQ